MIDLGTDTIALPDGTEVDVRLGLSLSVTAVRPPHGVLQMLPVSDFTASPLSGAGPLSVSTNNDTIEYGTMSYLWEKSNGGGWVSFSNSPTSYETTESFDVGTWSVRLTATNEYGSNAKTRTDYIVVSPPPPPPPPPPLNVTSANAFTSGALSINFDGNADGSNGFSMTINGSPATLSYSSGVGSSGLNFTFPETLTTGDTVQLSYSPGDVSNLSAFGGYSVNIPY